MYFKIGLLFLAFILVKFCESKSLNITKRLKITQLSPCKAQLDDGTFIDLTSLDNPSKPRTSEKDDYIYKFNPCSPIPCISGVQATSAVCQETLTGSLKYNLGDQSSAQLDENSDFEMTFSAGFRTSVITCVCSKSESFKFDLENPSSTYMFTFNSPCCCPNGCSGKKPGKGGLSFGSVLLIIFFSGAAAYLIGGFIFLKFVKKNNGTEAIPNLTFWASVPGDIKAGFSYTVSRVRGTQYSQF